MTWTSRSLPATLYPYGLWNNNAGRWLTVDDANSSKVVLTSDWTAFTTYDYFANHAVVSSPSAVAYNGAKWFVALGTSGLLRSTNAVGDTWALLTSDYSGALALGYNEIRSMVALPTGRIVAVATGAGLYGICTSDDDGATWVRRQVLTGPAEVTLGRSNELVCDGGSGQLFSSADGVTWTAASGYPSLTGGTMVIYALGANWLATCYDRYGGAVGRPQVSTNDGTTWADINTLGATGLSATASYYVALDAGGRVFMLDSNGTDHVVRWSDDLIAWTALDTTSAPAGTVPLGAITPLAVGVNEVVVGRYEYMSMGQWGMWSSPAPTTAGVAPNPPETVEDALLTLVEDALPFPGRNISDDILILADDTIPVNARDVIEDATADDLATPVGLSTTTPEDVATAVDEATPITALLQIDSANADEIVETQDYFVTVDTASADDLVTPAGGHVLDLADDATADDLASPTYATLVIDSADATELVFQASAPTVEDVADASDETFHLVADDADLTDLALAEELPSTFVTARVLADDVATAGDQTIYVRDDLIAWVMNTETGAVMWYSNWGFTDMTVANGRVLAVGPEGLAVLGGDTDDGVKIPAKLRYGYTDFGGFDREGSPQPSEPKKRVDNFMVGYTAGGVLNFTAKVQGYSTYRYTMASRVATDPRNNRIIPGKGLVGRYWQIGIENTRGAAFEVSSISADVAESNRRI